MGVKMGNPLAQHGASLTPFCANGAHPSSREPQLLDEQHCMVSAFTIFKCKGHYHDASEHVH